MMNLLLSGFALFWIFWFFVMVASLGLVAFNIWMTVDVVRRFASDLQKSVLYLLLIWLVPLGSIVYYVATVPPEERFIGKFLRAHKILAAGVLLVVLMLALVGSVAILKVTQRAQQLVDEKNRDFDRIQQDIEKARQQQKQMSEESEARREEFEREFDNFGRESENKAAIFKACVEKYYFGPNCEGPVPISVISEANKRGITDEAKIRDICQCTASN